MPGVRRGEDKEERLAPLNDSPLPQVASIKP